MINFLKLLIYTLIVAFSPRIHASDPILEDSKLLCFNDPELKTSKNGHFDITIHGPAIEINTEKNTVTLISKDNYLNLRGASSNGSIVFSHRQGVLNKEFYIEYVHELLTNTRRPYHLTGNGGARYSLQLTSNGPSISATLIEFRSTETDFSLCGYVNY